MGVIFANIFMNNKCINLKQKFDKSLYCKINKCTITFKDCSNCKYKEYKDNKKSTLIKKSPIKGKKHKITKETEISKNVKMTVWKRDNHRCIFCQKEVSWEYANSQYIKRSKLGMGIPENLMTNCERCHNLFEESIYREKMKEFAKNYLMSKYDYWNEEMLVYKKYTR